MATQVLFFFSIHCVRLHEYTYRLHMFEDNEGMWGTEFLWGGGG